MQIALALVLLVGAGLMVKTLVQCAGAPLGFNPNRLLGAYIVLRGSDYELTNDPARKVTPNVERFFRETVIRISALPGVKSTAIGRIPTRGWYRHRVRVIGRPEVPEDDVPRAMLTEISDDYFRVAEIPLARGRHFASRDSAGTGGVAIINQMLADELFGDEDPLGQVLQITVKSPFSEDSRRVADRPRTVVGVVADSTHIRPGDRPTPEIYYPLSQHMWDFPGGGQHGIHTRNGILIRTHVDPGTLQREVRKAIAEVDPRVVPTIESMDRFLARSVETERFWLHLLGLFATVALLLAAIGLYGVISYAVAQRSHEFGIRMALGAGRSAVLKKVLYDGLRLSLAGVAVGIAAALGLTRLIESQLSGVSPTDPLTFSAVTVVLLSVALLASYVPAVRATRVDRCRRCGTNRAWGRLCDSFRNSSIHEGLAAEDAP